MVYQVQYTQLLLCTLNYIPQHNARVFLFDTPVDNYCVHYSIGDFQQPISLHVVQNING